jgi:hypothetical protein
MIISKEVELVLGIKNHTFIKKKYNLSESLKPGDLVMVPVDILNKSSHFLVDVSCDYCTKELKVPFKRYNLSTKVVNKYSCSSKECSNQKIKDVCQSKYGVDNPFQSEEIKDKIKESLLEKYGVEHPMFMEKTKDKIKETCLDKYGFTSYTKTDECKEKIIKTNLERFGVKYELLSPEGQEKRKNTRIERGNQIPDELVSDYRKYRLIVNRHLQRNKKIIIENWNGLDYYDGELIRDNFNLYPKDRLYPHFDHKISVAYGFKNNIDADKIASLDNICITKQWINGLKKEMNEYEFKELLSKKEDI